MKSAIKEKTSFQNGVCAEAPGVDSRNRMLRNIEQMKKMEEEEKLKASFADSMAERVAKLCGNISFIIIHTFLIAAWIVLHAERFWTFDPYPYQALTLVLSVEAILLSSFILMSQNLEQRVSERRAKLDLQVNLLAEEESTFALRLLKKIADKLDIECEEEIEGLMNETDAAELAENITGENTSK